MRSSTAAEYPVYSRSYITSTYTYFSILALLILSYPMYASSMILSTCFCTSPYNECSLRETCPRCYNTNPLRPVYLCLYKPLRNTHIPNITFFLQPLATRPPRTSNYSRDRRALDVPVLLRIVHDRTVRAELAHLQRSPGQHKRPVKGRGRLAFAVVRMLFLIHSVRSWYAASTSSSALISAAKSTQCSHAQPHVVGATHKNQSPP